MLNIFVREVDGYKQDIYPVDNYIKQSSNFVSTYYNIDIDKATNAIKKILKNEKEIVNPTVKFLETKDNGDKVESETSLINYIKYIIKQEKIVAPSFTVYERHDKKKSLHVDFINVNIKERNKHKKLMFKYKMANDIDNFIIHNVIQGTKKIFNNSLSGSYASKSTILYNPSAHYTLTSITRCVASIGNTTTESFVAGNKHFKDVDTVLNYITAIITNTDLKTIRNVMDKYNLHYPTPKDTMDMVLKSSRNYWRDKVGEKEIFTYITRLNKYQRAAVVYVNDMYHLRVHNPDFVKSLLLSLSKKHKDLIPNIEDRKKKIDNTLEFINTLAKSICMSDIKGKELYKLSDDSEEINYISSTIYNLEKQFLKYQDLFQTFYRTDNLPITIADISDMLRETILVSDTDSTIATYDNWVEWMFGEVTLDDEAVALSAVVMSINSQIVVHNIKLFASNIGSSPEFYNVLQMKNEFFYTNFEVSNVAKTYFAEIMIQEGNVYSKPDKEIKGVHLINSKAPKEYRDKTMEFIFNLQKDVVNNNTIDIRKYIDKVIELEEEIIDKIYRGDTTILGFDKIKEEKSYKLDRYKSPYIHHLLWNNVFGDKYGKMEEPPYQALKVPVTTVSKNKMNLFLETIEDSDLKSRFKKFLSEYKKEYIGTYRLPLVKVANNGIPDELKLIVDKRKIILDILKPVYIALEVLGLYKKANEIYLDSGYGIRYENLEEL